VRVRAGATAVVALIAIACARSHADTGATPPTCLDPQRGPQSGPQSGPRSADCAPPAPPLSQTIATNQPRAQLSAFLVGTAQRAAAARDWAKAIPLFQALVVARGAGGPESRQLATLWTLAGQNERAAEAWRDYAAATADPAERSHAQAEAARLARVSDPFADKLVLTDQTADARRMFALGRAAFTARHHGDALVYFHMGYALAPDLPGFLRELGSTYDKLGAEKPKREFYLRYLQQRPIGSNADFVRSELAKEKDVLGTLQVSSSLPCSELWINRQRLTTKLPDKGFDEQRESRGTHRSAGGDPHFSIEVAPGNYKGLCFNRKFEMALFEYATVEAGKPVAMTFRWSIVENRLDHPFGRIALENPKAPGVMIDLGITSPEVGVAAPADGRKLKMILKDDSGVRTETRMVQIEPGQRLVVKW
jgi:hypothetical protein